MQKKILILILIYLLLATITYSQQTIKGIVKSDTNEALDGASVYFNNTTIGTVTNEKGEFQLNFKEGNYDLVVSYIGCLTKQIKINLNNEINFLSITLLPDTTNLDAVIIKKTKYDADWYYQLSLFKKNFLGRTKIADECYILNPKVLDFEFSENRFTATAREPLQIKHKSLGYLITYDLVDFSIIGNQLYYSGYAKYENLRKKIKKKWKQNRLVAYNGSQMHFFRSLLSEKLKEDGFIINQFKRVPNPDRPSEKEIVLAKELIQMHGGKFDFSNKKIIAKTPIDSALVVIRKSRLPKFVDYLYKTNVAYDEMVSFDEKNPYLDFNDHLSIIYTKEVEEKNYLIGNFGQVKKASGSQTSNIVLVNGKEIIDPSGVLKNPNAIFSEGYWGFESFANMLPLDYN